MTTQAFAAASIAALFAVTALHATPARADDPPAPTPAPAATPPVTTSTPAPTPAVKAPSPSPWGVLGVVGGAVAGLGAGVVSVSTVVLLQESVTTDHTKRAIEISIGTACILVGGTLIVVDGLTE